MGTGYHENPAMTSERTMRFLFAVYRNPSSGEGILGADLPRLLSAGLSPDSHSASLCRTFRMKKEAVRQLGAPAIVVNNAVIQRRRVQVLEQSQEDCRPRSA